MKTVKYLLMLALAVVSFALPVFAASNGTINYSYILSNVEFDLYKVGKVNADGTLALQGEFQAYPVPLDDTAAADTLLYYAQRDNLAPVQSVKTDSSKVAVFSDLENGVYLINGAVASSNDVKYTPQPVLIVVVNEVVDVTGKYEFEAETGTLDSGEGGGSGTGDPDDPSGSNSGSTSSDPGETNTGSGSGDGDSTSGGGSSDGGSSGGSGSSGGGSSGGSSTSGGSSSGGSSTSGDGSGDSSSSASYNDISVLKVWKGEETQSVTAQLLRNGEVYDEVELNSDNSWRYTWNSLSQSYKWTVVEKEVPDGYKVKIEKDASVFVITNISDDIYEEEQQENSENPSDVPSDSDSDDSSDSSVDESNPDEGDNPSDNSSENTETLPQTGQLWWPVAILACLGVMFLIIGIGCKRSGEKGNEN